MYSPRTDAHVCVCVSEYVGCVCVCTSFDLLCRWKTPKMSDGRSARTTPKTPFRSIIGDVKSLLNSLMAPSPVRCVFLLLAPSQSGSPITNSIIWIKSRVFFAVFNTSGPGWWSPLKTNLTYFPSVSFEVLYVPTITLPLNV